MYFGFEYMGIGYGKKTKGTEDFKYIDTREVTRQKNGE